MIQGVEVISGTGYDRANWSALQCFPSFISALHIQRVQVHLHRQAATFGIDERFLQEATHWVVHSGYLELYVIDPSIGLYKSSRGDGNSITSVILLLRGLLSSHWYLLLGYQSLGCLLDVNTTVFASIGTVPCLISKLQGYRSMNRSMKSNVSHP